MARGIPKGGVRRTATLTSALGTRGARIAGTLLGNLGRSDEEALVALERAHRQAAGHMAEILGSMKGGAMKLGQLASFLELGVVPPAYREIYTETLAALRDAAPTITFEEVRAVVEAELERPLEEVFGAFDETAAAAASIGQVHRARLPDGRAVAVKVQYPGVAEALEADVRTAQVLLPLAKAIAPGMDPRPLAAELRERLLEELDYELEAAAQRRFARAYRDHPFAVVPAVHTALSRRRVLVQDWVDGRSFEAVRALPQEERDRFGEMVYRFYWSGFHVLREVNADPHPGNYLMLEDGRVAFLDYGSVRAYSEDDVRRQLEMVQAAASGDAAGLLRAMEKMGYVREGGRTEAQELLEYVRWMSPHLVRDEAVTFDPEDLAQRLATLSDPRSRAFRIARRQNVPGAFLMLHRVDVSLAAVLSQLRATRNWQRIAREWWYGERPLTELGEAEAEWRRRLG